jgi:hypothetical protein
MPAIAQESQRILTQEFSSWRQPRVERKNEQVALEVCKDQCYYYTARGDMPDIALWDVALLHHLYFDRDSQADVFRQRHAKVGDAVMHSYDARCQGSGETAAKCVLSALAKSYDVRLAFVGYSEGLRCQISAKLTDPSWIGKRRTCTKNG